MTAGRKQHWWVGADATATLQTLLPIVLVSPYIGRVKSLPCMVTDKGRHCSRSQTCFSLRDASGDTIATIKQYLWLHLVGHWELVTPGSELKNKRRSMILGAAIRRYALVLTWMKQTLSIHHWQGVTNDGHIRKCNEYYCHDSCIPIQESHWSVLTRLGVS